MSVPFAKMQTIHITLPLHTYPVPTKTLFRRHEMLNKQEGLVHNSTRSNTKKTLAHFTILSMMSKKWLIKPLLFQHELKM